jgi:hypothetical protein
MESFNEETLMRRILLGRTAAELRRQGSDDFLD